MSSNVQILIGNIDYSGLVLYESIQVDNNIVTTNDTMNFKVIFNPGVDTVTDSNNNVINATRPKVGQEVIWQNPNVIIKAPDGSNKPFREFGGVITQLTETIDGINLVYDVQCGSYIKWFDRHLVAGIYNQAPPETIIKSIVSQYCPGFTTYNVQTTNDAVTPQYFDYKKPSEACKSLADLLEFGFYIDSFRDCHFDAAESFTTPLPNNTLDVDNDVVNYGELEITENGEQQYNKVFLKGFKTRDTNFTLLSFTGDGNSNQWNTGYRPSSLANDNAVVVYPSMAAYNGDTSFKSGGSNTAGVLMSVKRDLVDGAPNAPAANNTAYLNYSQQLLRIPNYNNAGNVPSGYVVVFRMHLMKDTVFLAQDPSASSITAGVEGTDGIYEYVHTDKSLTNSTLNAVTSKAQLLLQKYGLPQITGKFNTYFNGTNASGWMAGQYFTLRTTNRFGGLNEIMFVQRVTKTLVKNDSNALITLYNVEYGDSMYLV